MIGPLIGLHPRWCPFIHHKSYINCWSPVWVTFAPFVSYLFTCHNSSTAGNEYKLWSFVLYNFF